MPVAAADWVGHGRIRLHGSDGEPAESSESAPEPAPAPALASSGSCGHGKISLHPR